MGKSLKIIAYSLLFIRLIAILTAFVYLLIWFIQFHDTEAFLNFNQLHGAIPAKIDTFITYTVLLNGHEATCGYVYFSGLLALAYIFIKNLEEKIHKIQKEVENKEIEKALAKMLEQRKKQKQEKKKIQRRSCRLYGLFELELTNFGMNKEFFKKEKRIKKEYSKMLVDKIKAKYPTVKFIKSDKIFIIAEDYSVLDSLFSDIKRIYKVFYELNNKKAIQTDLILSFWSDSENKSMKYALRVLKKLNKLKNKDKVLFCEKTLDCCFGEIKKNNVFVPYGAISLDDVEKNTTLALDMFYVQNKLI